MIPVMGKQNPRGIAKVEEGKKLEIADRRRKIARLVEGGTYSSASIKQALAAAGTEVSVSTILRDMQALEADYKALAAVSMEHEKGKTLARLERMVAKLQPEVNRGSVQAIRMWKEIEETRAKLLGMNKPSKIAHTDPEGDKEYQGIPRDFKLKFFSQQVIDSEGVDEEIEDAEIIPDKALPSA